MTHVEGTDDGHGYGVRGTSKRLNGTGVLGRSESGFGVKGETDSGDGMFGMSKTGVGVRAQSNDGYAVHGESMSGYGVLGKSKVLSGVWGLSDTDAGVVGQSTSSVGLYGHSNNSYGVYAVSYSEKNIAALLAGNVTVTGNLEKAGGSFKIDHPLDPANKYLYHSFVESPDMKNVYDGVVVLDNKGEAEIDLPDWFSALNKDFRYQLTAIRQDPWANANPIEVEEDKPDKERGYYLHPDLYGPPEEKGISHILFPQEEKKKPQLIINEKKHSNL